MSFANHKEINSYFIALLPYDNCLKDLNEFQSICLTELKAKNPQSSPPHVTLHMPFYYKTKKIDNLIYHLNEFTKKKDSFEINIDGFSSFPPRVIYAAISENRQLDDFQKGLENVIKTKLKIHNANYRNHKFKPHITIASRGLKKTNFDALFSKFENLDYKASFTASNLFLMRKAQKQWQVYKEFPLV